jgi:protein TonB
VVLVHIVIFWGLQNGLAGFVVDLINGPMETKLIEEIKPEKEAPPPPPPKFQALPPPVVIPLDIQVEAPPADTSTSISETAQKRAAAPTASKDVIVPPRSNPRRPVTQPEYPPTSKRLGEQGTVVMLLTVNEEGKVIEAKIDKSSGFERLDEAALNEAKRAWRLLPGTVNGKPTSMQYRFAVTFKITDQ